MFQLSEKGRGVRQMFDDIAHRYDLLNRFRDARLGGLRLDRYLQRDPLGGVAVSDQGCVARVPVSGLLSGRAAAWAQALVRVAFEPIGRAVHG